MQVFEFKIKSVLSDKNMKTYYYNLLMISIFSFGIQFDNLNINHMINSSTNIKRIKY